MGAQLRVYKDKIHSAESTKKITRAMELISASRIQKARSRSDGAKPFANAITLAVSAVATHSVGIAHPLLKERPVIRRSAVVLFTSDRGLAGAFSSNILSEGERLSNLLRAQGEEIDYYLVGRKAVGYFNFREREYVKSWTGWTEKPTAADAHDLATTLQKAFLLGGEHGGVDDIHIVYNRFISMMTQTPEIVRLLPLKVVEADESQKRVDFPLYDFEPEPDVVLDALLPRYIESKLFSAMLESAASKHAATQRAMKSAGDNADKQVKHYNVLMNTARQAEITQQISEIVGGADALTQN